LPKPKESSSVNTETTPQKESKTSRKAVFMMRAEGQRWEDFKKVCIDSFRKKGMLTEKKQPAEEQLNVPKNGDGIGQQRIEGETDE
jgi:hypothetical protein